MTILVTGATGLIGANVAAELLKRGKKVRTMVRNPNADDAHQLRKIGVEVVTGEISQEKAVMAAAKNVNGIIHSAAMLGRPGSSMEEGFSANVLGTLHVYTAAMVEGNVPMVQVITSTFFDMWDKPLTESSPLDRMYRNTDAYSVTKRLGYVEGVVRAAEGQEIRFMLPGAAYGPSVCIEKAMANMSWDARIAMGIQGKMSEQIPIAVPWVYVQDCAWVCVEALEKGKRGERYMALGRASDVQTIANGVNKACEIAGVTHRVRDIPKDKLDSPEVIAKYGQTMPVLAKRTYPEPFFDSSFTERRLGYKPTALDDGLRITIDWMRKNKIV
jgi:dihydroflavonol-4-reductase